MRFPRTAERKVVAGLKMGPGLRRDDSESGRGLPRLVELKAPELRNLRN